MPARKVRRKVTLDLPERVWQRLDATARSPVGIASRATVTSLAFAALEQGLSDVERTMLREMPDEPQPGRHGTPERRQRKGAARDIERG